MNRLSDKPFALLGVNSDSDREELKRTIQDEEITWRSWWDAGSVDGPIQTKWQIEQRPALYLLDAQGIIRYKLVEADELDLSIDLLLRELEHR